MSIKDFQIITKLGYKAEFLNAFFAGEGAYSSVYKVKRTADNSEYALKKVKLQNLSEKER